MISALDSSVILDVLTGGGAVADSAIRALHRVRLEGKIVICECVLAEIYPAFSDERQLREFLQDWQLDFVPCSEESALLAGKYFSDYLQRVGQPKRVLPDFLIGAHARIQADRLVARDRGYLRSYLTDLVLIDPRSETWPG